MICLLLYCIERFITFKLKCLAAIVNDLLMICWGNYGKCKFIYRQNSGFSSQHYRYHRRPLTKKLVSYVFVNCEMLDLFGNVYKNFVFLMGWGLSKTGCTLCSWSDKCHNEHWLWTFLFDSCLWCMQMFMQCICNVGSY